MNTNRSPPKSVTGRALAILAAFDVEHPRLTLSELSRRSGLPVATVFRLASELEEWRALDRDEQGRYGVGFRLWEMGLLAPVHRRLRETALPWLLQVQHETKETVQLAACDGMEAIYIEKLTSEESVPVTGRIGARLPLHASGVGKALLAFRGAAFAEAVLLQPLKAYTEWTITERGVLQRQLAQIRQRGYSTSRQEYHEGSSSIAVPVLVSESAVAAIGLVSYRLRDDLEQYVPAVKRAAEGIAARLHDASSNPFPSLSGTSGEAPVRST
jgi:DNA-binding IclR family transcriptional regulator